MNIDYEKIVELYETMIDCDKSDRVENYSKLSDYLVSCGCNDSSFDGDDPDLYFSEFKNNPIDVSTLKSYPTWYIPLAILGHYIRIHAEHDKFEISSLVLHKFLHNHQNIISASPMLQR